MSSDLSVERLKSYFLRSLPPSLNDKAIDALDAMSVAHDAIHSKVDKSQQADFSDPVVLAAQGFFSAIQTLAHIVLPYEELVR